MRARSSSRARRAALCLLASFAALSCSPDLRGTPADYQLLVFPGEAELGGSAAAIINSNYMPGADEFEDYTLERSRVGIRIKDAAAVEWSATVRAVFPFAASATSRLAQARPGAWATVVLFDLPKDPAPPAAPINLGSGPPFLADVIVRIDGVAQLDDEAIGSIRITGRGGAGIGGQPTTLIWPPLSNFELDSVVARFRPVLDTDSGTPGGGFPDESGGTVIAGLEADLVYFSPCFTDAEPYTGTEAADAGIHLGPQLVVGGGEWSFFVYRHLVVTHPQGFTLTNPAGGAPSALGEGPLIDIAFDRPNQSVFDCPAITEPMLWLSKVYAVRPDGTTIADQRAETLLDASDLFTLHSIPPVP